MCKKKLPPALGKLTVITNERYMTILAPPREIASGSDVTDTTKEVAKCQT